jgi:hypothetical protein
MTPRLFRYELALLTILCVIGLLVFPATVGSYTSVHGPVSALLAVRAAMRVRRAMAIAGLSFSQFLLHSWFAQDGVPQGHEVVCSSPPGHILALRC